METYPHTARLLIPASSAEEACDLGVEEVTDPSYRIRVPRRGPTAVEVSPGRYQVTIRYGVDVPQVRRPHHR